MRLFFLSILLLTSNVACYSRLGETNASSRPERLKSSSPMPLKSANQKLQLVRPDAETRASFKVGEVVTLEGSYEMGYPVGDKPGYTTVYIIRRGPDGKEIIMNSRGGSIPESTKGAPARFNYRAKIEAPRQEGRYLLRVRERRNLIVESPLEVSK